MPTYAYECSACGHRFEEFQTMTAAPLRKCPACSKQKLQRLIGAGAGVIFKGSGFYETDYKKAAKTPGDKAAAPESKGSDATPTTSKSDQGKATPPATNKSGSDKPSNDKGR
ncbi:MAG: zinc ribbon domain-containing protein [Planctomycetota bacterium]